MHIFLFLKPFCNNENLPLQIIMAENKSSSELPDKKTLDMNKEWVQELEAVSFQVFNL